MNDKAVPTWLLAVPVVGLGELTYWLYSRFGVNLAVQISFVATVLAAFIFLILYFIRWKNNRTKS